MTPSFSWPSFAIVFTALAACSPQDTPQLGAAHPSNPSSATTGSTSLPVGSSAASTPPRRARALPATPKPQHPRLLDSRALPPAQIACVRALRRDNARIVALPEDASGATQISWLVTEAPDRSGPDRGCPAPPTQDLALHVERGTTTKRIRLTASPGRVLPADASACTAQPRATEGCASIPRPPTFANAAGVLAQLGVVATCGYNELETRKWYLVREDASLLVIESTHPWPPLYDALCDGAQTRVAALITGGGDTIHEAIFLSTPASPDFVEIDCTAAWRDDGRCAG